MRYFYNYVKTEKNIPTTLMKMKSELIPYTYINNIVIFLDIDIWRWAGFSEDIISNPSPKNWLTGKPARLDNMG